MEKELLIVHKRYFQNYKLLLLPLCNVVWHSKLLQSSWPITLGRLFLWGPALQPFGRVDLSEQNLVSTTVPCVSLNSLQHSHAWWRLCVCGCWLSAHRLLNLRTRNVIAVSTCAHERWPCKHRWVVLSCSQPNVCACDDHIRDLPSLWHHTGWRVEKTVEEKCLEHPAVEAFGLQRLLVHLLSSLFETLARFSMSMHFSLSP